MRKKLIFAFVLCLSFLALGSIPVFASTNRTDAINYMYSTGQICIDIAAILNDVDMDALAQGETIAIYNHDNNGFVDPSIYSVTIDIIYGDVMSVSIMRRDANAMDARSSVLFAENNVLIIANGWVAGQLDLRIWVHAQTLFLLHVEAESWEFNTLIANLRFWGRSIYGEGTWNGLVTDWYIFNLPFTCWHTTFFHHVSVPVSWAQPLWAL